MYKSQYSYMGWLVSSLIRLVIPFSIFVWPFWGSVASVLADIFDVVIEDLLGVRDFSLYNQIDKFWDTYFYIIQALVARKWKNQLAQKIAWGLLAYRFIGVVIYELWPQRWLLMVFPNVFIWFFLFYVFTTRLLQKDFITSPSNALFWVVLFAIPKIYQEYLFHVVQIPLYQTLKPLLFFL